MVVILFSRIEIVSHVYNAVKWVPVAHTLLLFYSKECHNFSTLMKLEKKKVGKLDDERAPAPPSVEHTRPDTAALFAWRFLGPEAGIPPRRPGGWRCRDNRSHARPKITYHTAVDVSSNQRSCRGSSAKSRIQTP
jgi:hypothetical protein